MSTAALGAGAPDTTSQLLSEKDPDLEVCSCYYYVLHTRPVLLSVDLTGSCFKVTEDWHHRPGHRPGCRRGKAWRERSFSQLGKQSSTPCPAFGPGPPRACILQSGTAQAVSPRRKGAPGGAEGRTQGPSLPTSDFLQPTGCGHTAPGHCSGLCAAEWDFHFL